MSLIILMIPGLSQALSRASARHGFHNHFGSRWYHPRVPAGEAEAYLGWGRGLGQGLTMKSQKTPRTSAFKASALPFCLLSIPCPPSILHLWKLRTQIERFPFPKITCQGEVDEG